MSIFGALIPDGSHLVKPSYAMSQNSEHPIPNELKPYFKFISFREMMTGFTFTLFKAANATDPISWHGDHYQPVRLIYFIRQASVSCLVAKRLGDPVNNPVILTKTPANESNADLKTRQDAADAAWVVKFDDLFPFEMSIFPDEDLKGFYVLTSLGLEITSASLKSNMPASPDPMFPCETPGSKRSAPHTENTEDSDEEESSSRATRVKSEEKEEKKIQKSAITLCRLLDLQNTKTDARCRSIMGESRQIESRDCVNRMQTVLSNSSYAAFPAISANSLLLQGYFSERLEVNTKGELMFQHLLAFQKRDENGRFVKVKKISYITTCVTNLLFIYSSIEKFPDPSSTSSIATTTGSMASLHLKTPGVVLDSRPLLKIIFSQMLEVLNFSLHTNLSQVSIDYILQEVSKCIKNVFLLLRNEDNLKLSRTEFLELACPVAILDADAIFKKKDSQDALNVPDQMATNMYKPYIAPACAR